LKTFANLVSGIEKIKVTGNPDVEINKVEVDSRKIEEGDLFIAVPGHLADGLEFVPEVANKKAAAIVSYRDFDADVPCKGVTPNIRAAIAKIAAEFYEHPDEKLKLIGVSGTNGKTTITHLLQAILKQKNVDVGLIGTLGYSTANYRFESINTTPGALELEQLLTIMVNERLRYAVMEVSSHALAMKRVEELQFQVVAISNVTQDHLDYHTTFENYLKVKAHLIELVEGKDRWVVLNMDDPNFDFLSRYVNSSFLTFSQHNNKADVTIENLNITSNGSTFDLITPFDKEHVKLNLLGRFNVENALCATCCALGIGLDLSNICQGLEKAQPVSGRAEVVNCGQPYTILVDYAHTPDALTRILESAREFCKNKLLVLFGCGGDRDKTKRPLMGTAASSSADIVIVTSDNPRSEDPYKIIEDIKPGLDSSKLTIIEPDRRKAIHKAIELTNDDDTLVVAGKGHETYQIIGDTTTHFDDREIVEQYLQEILN